MSYIRNRLIASTFLASFAILGGASGVAHATGPAPCTVPTLSPGPVGGLGDRIDRLEDLRQIEELRARCKAETHLEPPKAPVFAKRYQRKAAV